MFYGLSVVAAKRYPFALINPVAINLIRKIQVGITKNDKIDTMIISDVLASSQRIKSYRIIR